jgi:hypothetical protein
MNFWNFRLIFTGTLFLLMVSGCQNDDTGTSNATTAINQACQRIEGCAGTAFTPQEMQACKQVALSVGLVLPEPEYFSDCFQQPKSCWFKFPGKMRSERVPEPRDFFVFFRCVFIQFHISCYVCNVCYMKALGAEAAVNDPA